MKKRNVNFQTTDEQLQKLKKYAEQDKRTQSSVIRIAIDEFLLAHKIPDSECQKA